MKYHREVPSFGPQGPQGDQGNRGFQGNQGFQGDDGNQGDQGDQGDQGNQGNQGNQGDQGDQGDGLASYYAYSEGESSTTAETFQDKVSLTLPLVGNYEVFWSYELVGSAGGYDAVYRVWDGSNEINGGRVNTNVGYNANGWDPLTGLKYLTIAVPTTITIQWRRQNSGIIYIRRARILANKLS